MHFALRPYVTTGVALVGASVLVAAPITVTPPDIRQPISIVNPDIEQASLVSDLVEDVLVAFNAAAQAGGNTAGVLLAAGGALPDALARLTQAGIENPALIPNLISALTYGFLNPPTNFIPPDDIPIPSLLTNLLIGLAPLLGLVPPALQPALGEAIGALSEALANALGILPDPLPGVAAANLVDLPDIVANLTGATLLLGTALAQSAAGIGAFIGAAPAQLLGLAQVVANNPSLLPNALSSVVWSLIGTGYPPTSLLGIVLAPTLIALTQILPPPIGSTGGFPPNGLIAEAGALLDSILNRILGELPPPLIPAVPLTASPAGASTLIAEPDRPIEDGINALLYRATEVGLYLAQLPAPVVARVLDISEPEAEAFLALGALGFAGPLISGTGAAGHAVQDLVDSRSFGEVIENTLDLVRLPIGGVVNGGQGPNLKPLLPFLPDEIPTPIPDPPIVIDIPVSAVYAPGLIENPGYQYPAQLQGLGLQPQGTGLPSSYHLITPGTVPTLQGLVTRVFGQDEAPSAFRVSGGGDNVQVAGAVDSGDAKEVKKDTRERNRPVLNLVRQSLGADTDGVKGEAGTTGRHRVGTPVRDLINKVVNGGKKKADDAPKDDPKPAE